MLVLATTNLGKLQEFGRLAPELDVKPIGAGFQCEETGATFLANAHLKAVAGARFSGYRCLADDSGLCVEALSGEPGIYSARYYRDGAGMRDILARLQGQVSRRAWYVCALAVAEPYGAVVWSTERYWYGCIAFEPRGDNGFGYDPIFVPDDGDDRTVAELDDATKDHLSHRALAVRDLMAWR
jgi:XTP/dITP diphosphohydrolase